VRHLIRDGRPGDIRVDSPSLPRQAYEINDAELFAAFRAIDLSLEPFAGRANVDPAALPWTALRLLITMPIYGGKIGESDVSPPSRSMTRACRPLTDILPLPTTFSLTQTSSSPSSTRSSSQPPLTARRSCLRRRSARLCRRQRARRSASSSPGRVRCRTATRRAGSTSPSRAQRPWRPPMVRPGH
jgi:hypothetical protein